MSILDCANSPTSRPSTILEEPSPVTLTGNEEMMPSSTPYWPPDGTAIDTRPSAPRTQSWTWSIAALAAEAADDAPRASMIAAPRLPTLGRYSFSYQAMSSTASTAGLPLTVALNRSGNIVGEWLPQMTRFSMSVSGMASLDASCP